jgi:hypothetical protein
VRRSQLLEVGAVIMRDFVADFTSHHSKSCRLPRLQDLCFPLYYATLNRNTEVVRRLVNAGADVTAMTPVRQFFTPTLIPHGEKKAMLTPVQKFHFLPMHIQ